MAYRQALNPAMRAACSASLSSRLLCKIPKSILQRASFSSVSVSVNVTRSSSLSTTRPLLSTLQHRYLSNNTTQGGGGGEGEKGGSVGFNFAGPQKLSEVLRLDLIQNKTPHEIQDLWLTYHETKPNVHGLILPGPDAKTILTNATKCPFFISPIFRDSGFFMLLSQFMSPHHFLLAYLEDYKLDPARAQPLVSISIFEDLVESHGVSLVRCDVMNQAVSDHEAYRVVSALMESYKKEEEFMAVQTFNLAPERFDVDDYISRKSLKWREEDEGKGDNDLYKDAAVRSTDSTDETRPRP